MQERAEEAADPSPPPAPPQGAERGGPTAPAARSAGRRIGGALSVLARPGVRLALLGMVLMAGLLVVRSAGGVSRAGVERVVVDTGVLAPVAYVVLYAVLTVLLVPGSVITAAGGVLFGAVSATALTVVGATAGATGAFAVARLLGREQVERMAGGRLGRVDAWLVRRGFLAVLYVRLVPVFPFNVMNYVAGVTGIRPRAYVLATALGIIPGTFAFAAIGANIDDLTSPELLGAVALLLALAVGGPLVDRRMRARGHDLPRSPTDATRASRPPARSDADEEPSAANSTTRRQR